MQTRSVTYDALGRKTWEQIPEWSAGTASAGTSSYTYDSSSSCSGSSAGDLIKSVDNAGNVTCLTYDSLHRPLSATVVSGPYASVTPVMNYVYDAATYNGTAMQNALGSLAEAYTGTSSSKLTDLYFSKAYGGSGATAGGVVSKVWEATPHSGGYFLTTDTYYPNGALGVRTASYGVPSLSFGLDGEGRPNAATDTTYNLNLVTGASYNPASAATGVSYGNGDSDAFGYDAMNRPSSIVFNVAGGSPFSITNSLNWNANSSLQQMQVTDTNDSTKSQNCNYSADDLSRIAKVDCGSSTWVQTFTYDAFGNINKTGNPGTSYSAAYSPVTNQVSGGPSYDANGNQLTSTPANLTWNALNLPISVNSTTATYDALGRMVEKGSGGTYTQFVFSPSGSLLAEYSGSLVKGTIRLPGGGTAIYNGSGLNYIRHTDWLGSSRLATTWGHAVYSKEAYAPFGETYNEAGTPDRSFTGQDQDVVTGSLGNGVYDFLFRKYDPSAGRWLSPDPAGWSSVSPTYPQSLNRYANVQNNPLSLTDPDGKACITTDDGLVSIDNQGPIGDACTGYGGVYVPGDMDVQAGDYNALLAGLMSFSMVDSTGTYVSYDSTDAAQQHNFNGTISASESEMLSDMRTALTGVQSDGDYLDSYSFHDDQWFTNGNIWPGYKNQDGICSHPMPQGMNSSLLVQGACNGHDVGYEMYHCNSSSWIPLMPGPCTMVNLEGAVGIVVAQVISWIGKVF